MKKLLLILILLMLFPFNLTADDDDSDDERNGRVVLQDGDGKTVGDLLSSYNDSAFVWVDLRRHSALLRFTPHELIPSWPAWGPMLFFELPDCDEAGEIYARPELINEGWIRPRAFVTRGRALHPPPHPEISHERFAWIAATEHAGDYEVRSHLTPEGFCNPMGHPDTWIPGEWPPETHHIWKVEKTKACRGRYGYDLHWCFPPPYDIVKK